MSGADQIKQKQSVLLAIYGQGGHRTEMERLLGHLNSRNHALAIVSLGCGEIDGTLAHFVANDIRDKHSRLTSLLLFIPTMFGLVMNVLRICRRYKVSGVISTGPGLCIIPMLLMRLMGYKTVFVETFCRFNSRSMTGRVMYKIAHRFLIQNKQLQALYPDADYCGRI